MNDLEFEKNRQEILRNTKLKKGNNQRNNSKEHLWKYEIEKYRKQRKKEFFYTIGSIAGIISLIITIALHFYEITALLKSFF